MLAVKRLVPPVTPPLKVTLPAPAFKGPKSVVVPASARSRLPPLVIVPERFTPPAPWLTKTEPPLLLSMIADSVEPSLAVLELRLPLPTSVKLNPPPIPPVNAMSPPPPILLLPAKVTGPRRLAAVVLELISAPPPAIPAPLIVTASLPTDCPLRSSTAPEATTVPPAVEPKALALPKAIVPALIVAVPEYVLAY